MKVFINLNILIAFVSHIKKLEFFKNYIKICNQNYLVKIISGKQIKRNMACAKEVRISISMYLCSGLIDFEKFLS